MESRDMASKTTHGNSEGLCAFCWHTKLYKHWYFWRDHHAHEATWLQKCSSCNSLASRRQHEEERL